MVSLLGMHDIEGAAVSPVGTWIVDTIGLSANLQGRDYVRLAPDRQVIVRANWGYGSAGTLPTPGDYDLYVAALTRYVSESRGCRRWVIGNEPNLPREWPDFQPIRPSDYADVYRAARDSVHRLAGHERDEVLIAASGPWNAQYKYTGNEKGDWVKYTLDCIAPLGQKIDGVALHAYCHGYNPDLAASTVKMGGDFPDRFYEFLTFVDYLDAFPTYLGDCSFYITESNGDGPWQATGLIPAMLKTVNDWNVARRRFKVKCLTTFRYPRQDDPVYYMEGREDVMSEYLGAVPLYNSPLDGVQPAPEPPQPEPAPEPAPEPDGYLQEWDARLPLRGTQLAAVESRADFEWHITHGKWFDKEEAQGRVNTYITVLDEEGDLAVGVPVRWWWQSGDDTKPTEIKHDPWLGHDYSLDFNMTEPAPSFGFAIDNGEPSDQVTGLGLGSLTQPDWKIHTAYSFTIQRFRRAPKPTPPPPTDLTTGSVTARAGLNLRVSPNTDSPILGVLVYGSTVIVDDQQNGFYHSVDGWVSSEFVGAAGEGLAASTPPRPAPAPTGDSRLDPLAAEAIYNVESGGAGFAADGKLIIRFEAHLFKAHLGDDQAFDLYFRYGDPPWTGQFFRVDKSADWRPIHTGHQDSEWQALKVAASLNFEAGLLSISMGAPQILGSNYRRILHSSVTAMYDAFARSLAAQDIGFFNYCLADPELVQAINSQDWATVARKYNGPGQVEDYSKKMADAYAALVA